MILVHDYLIQMGGAERVVATMANAFPSAPIYTSATHRDELFPVFTDERIKNSFVQHLPGLKRHFKKYFPFYPFAFYFLKIPFSEAIWISSSSFAKFIKAPSGAKTFCYCHAPTRFLWDTDVYVDAEISNPVVNFFSRMLLPPLRKMDLAAASRMSYIIANSENVKNRIKRVYGRDVDVIHPPVNVDNFTVSHENKGYDILISRLIGYKRIDLAVEAYNGTNRQLRIIGDGTDRKRLEQLAGPNVTFLGRVSEEEMTKQLAGARASLFPGEEDFGISPVESQACGKPVIAYGAGGALETVVDGVTGVFFKEPTPDSLRDAVERSESIQWNAEVIRKHAEGFSEAVFLEKMITYMEEKTGSNLRQKVS